MNGGLKARFHVQNSWPELMDRAFSPRIYHLRAKTWGGTPGWDGAGPLALEPTEDVVFGQTGRLDILGPSANGAA